MLLREILQVKGDKVYSIEPSATLADVVQRLVEFNCGSLVVCDGGKMVGIITERDILRACAALDEPLESIPVEARMTADVVTGAPDNTVNETMGVMTEKRIRHLPVMDQGQLVGMVSIGDIVKAQHAELSVENHYLKNYIQS